MIKRMIIAVFLCTVILFGYSQQADKIIIKANVERIEQVLSADDMQGRKTFTPGIDKAAAFISEEFKKTGLKYFPGLNTHHQEFSLIKAKFTSASGNINGQPISEDQIIAITTEASMQVTHQSGYTITRLDTGLTNAQLSQQARLFINKSGNHVVLVPASMATHFKNLKRFKRDSFKRDFNTLFILTDEVPASYSFDIKHDISSSALANVVGMIPGKSKPGEYVIFSAHYDHLGIGKPNAAGDSIYNGANDDAAGTTAVILLADYFSKLKNNERSIIFVAFTAEEIGGYGSQYFSRQLDPGKVIAMFNIEMIGTESKWGKNSAYITGYEKSDMGQIMQKNLDGSVFRFEPDPYPKQNLFYRSDNATLAAMGVPAHTISTSQMDQDKTYHTQEDEIETLDLENMTAIIKAIALSSSSIVNGKDTPTRVEIAK